MAQFIIQTLFKVSCGILVRHTSQSAINLNWQGDKGTLFTRCALEYDDDLQLQEKLSFFCSTGGKKALRDLPTPQQFELRAFWGMLLYLLTTRGIRLIVLSAAWLENMKRNDGNGSKGNKTFATGNSKAQYKHIYLVCSINTKKQCV